MQERHQVICLQIPPEISNDVDRFFALCEANNHCVVQKQVMYQFLVTVCRFVGACSIGKVLLGAYPVISHYKSKIVVLTVWRFTGVAKMGVKASHY